MSNGRNELLVDLPGMAGLLRAGDILTEAVERDSETLAAESGCGAQSVVHMEARDEPRRHAAAHGGALGKTAKTGRSGKGNERGPQQRHFAPKKANVHFVTRLHPDQK